MPRRSTARKSAPKTRSRRSGRRLRLSRFWPARNTRRRWFKAFRRTPAGMQIFLSLVVLAALALAVNWIYQVVRKPTELFFPVSGVLYKTPTETWDTYAPLFRRHSTAVMTPELLAALAQVEGSGNPIVRTYWRWSLKGKPFEIYRPASSAVGMYQFTDGTFELAKRYCIHDHVAVEDGPWNDWRSCWFNSLYLRVVPSHAVELTSAFLDRSVANILARRGIRNATLQQKQNLATLIHLCGPGAGEAYARRGLSLSAGQRCGDHDARVYVARVNTMKGVFARLNARS